MFVQTKRVRQLLSVVGPESRVFLLGDIHGRAGEVYDRMYGLDRCEHLRHGDIVICLGDVGISYGGMVNPRVLEALESCGARYGVTFLVIRGNHDDRYVRDARAGRLLSDTFERDERFGGEAWRYQNLWSHIVFLSDVGGIYDIAGTRALVIPGAYSIDKDWRITNGWPWEPEEQLSFDERDALLLRLDDEKVDAVLSHTCPLSWFRELGDLLMPGGLAADNTMEMWMDTILERVAGNCHEWWFGHFHSDRNVDGIGHLLYQGYGQLGSGEGVCQLLF